MAHCEEKVMKEVLIFKLELNIGNKCYLLANIHNLNGCIT